jgi:hypothetical protein
MERLEHPIYTCTRRVGNFTNSKNSKTPYITLPPAATNMFPPKSLVQISLYNKPMKIVLEAL